MLCAEACKAQVRASAQVLITRYPDKPTRTTSKTPQISARPDHWYFGRPEHSKVKRIVYTASPEQPGADLAAEYAAAYASAAVLFKQAGKEEYAATLYKHAKQAFAFAEAYPEK